MHGECVRHNDYKMCEQRCCLSCNSLPRLYYHLEVRHNKQIGIWCHWLTENYLRLWKHVGILSSLYSPLQTEALETSASYLEAFIKNYELTIMTVCEMNCYKTYHKRY